MAIHMFFHSHRFGSDTKLVRVPDDINLVDAFYNADDEKQIEIAKVFDIDFEPDREEESLDVEAVNLDNIMEVNDTDLLSFITRT
jgi:hypothetical protein